MFNLLFIILAILLICIYFLFFPAENFVICRKKNYKKGNILVNSNGFSYIRPLTKDEKKNPNKFPPFDFKKKSYCKKYGNYKKNHGPKWWLPYYYELEKNSEGEYTGDGTVKRCHEGDFRPPNWESPSDLYYTGDYSSDVMMNKGNMNCKSCENLSVPGVHGAAVGDWACNKYGVLIRTNPDDDKEVKHPDE